MDLARFGALDITRINFASLNNAFPATQSTSLPTLRTIWPFYLALSGVLLVVAFVPALSLWLPAMSRTAG